MPVVDPHRLIESLCAEPRETEWLEFKLNRFEANDCGRYISALANAAMFHEKERAYLIFGVDDDTHEILGTEVRLRDQRIGNEPFENWINRLLHPQTNLKFISAAFDDRVVEMIVITPAYVRPVRFMNDEMVRVGSVQKRLRDFPERERAIWQITTRFVFEQSIVATHLTETQIIDEFDCLSLLNTLKSEKVSRKAVFDQLLMEGMIIDDKQGAYDITGLFALMAAKDLSRFKGLAKKAPRVVEYTTTTKLEGKGGGDVTGRLGYAMGFPRLLRYIMSKIPQKEELSHGVRNVRHGLPENAIRELVANALIHQDLSSAGDGPLIEIFSDRVRIINPGKPLVPPDRFIDAPPKSRNEKLAGLMKRFGYCEERGSGVDRALDACEAMALPAPMFQASDSSTIATLFGERPFSAMSKEDRIRACYQHASLKFEAGSRMSNSTFRARLGLNDKQYPQVSVVIRDAIEAKLIRPLDEDQANRNARYVPWWA